MQCLNCGGQLEWAGGGQHARCMRCLSLFSQQNGSLTPPGACTTIGGFNPDFNNIFASNLGFGPPPPGAQPMPPPAGGMGGPPNNNNLGAGQFDLGGGQQLRVKINGQTPENYLKNRASSMIWGWIIGLVIVGIMVLTGIGFGIYIWFAARNATADVAVNTGTPVAAKWDGKSVLQCGGNDVIAVTGTTATQGITVGGNCKVTLVNVNVTAPVGLDVSGNGGVTMTGGSITSSTTAVNASGNAKVVMAGTKVSGKVTRSGNATVVGAN